jgi:FKBP-type peptidyl-prolyl cis-trans isomerase FkpA
MKRTVILLHLIISLFIICSCNNGSKESNNSKNSISADTIKNYNKDSVNEETIVLIDNDNLLIVSANYIDTVFRNKGNGLVYRFVKRNNGTNPEIGDVLTLHLEYYTENDSLLFSSYDVPDDFRMRLEKPSHPGSIEEALTMMHTGDSAIFKINAYNFYKYTRKLINIPEYIKPGELLTFNVKLLSIQHSDLYEQEKRLREAEIRDEEISLINRYLLTENLNSTELSSGIHIVEISQSGGRKLKAGDYVEMHYDASFLDGLIFDSTYESGLAFGFELGSGELIPGLEIALSHMHIGDKSKIIIPFALAYGSEIKGPIPPYTTLVFDVEIISANGK